MHEISRPCQISIVTASFDCQRFPADKLGSLGDIADDSAASRHNLRSRIARRRIPGESNESKRIVTGRNPTDRLFNLTDLIDYSTRALRFIPAIRRVRRDARKRGTFARKTRTWLTSPSRRQARSTIGISMPQDPRFGNKPNSEDQTSPCQSVRCEHAVDRADGFVRLRQ